MVQELDLLPSDGDKLNIDMIRILASPIPAQGIRTLGKHAERNAKKRANKKLRVQNDPDGSDDPDSAPSSPQKPNPPARVRLQDDEAICGFFLSTNGCLKSATDCSRLHRKPANKKETAQVSAFFSPSGLGSKLKQKK